MKTSSTGRAPDPLPVPPRLCPLCGTRASAKATRCLVCGTSLVRPSDRLLQQRQRRFPNPFALALVAASLMLGASLLGMATGNVPVPAVLLFDTPTITPTDTPAPTSTVTGTPTPTPLPTDTPQPPVDYQVQDGDSCLLIALNYGVNVESIIMLNGLDPDCTIAVGSTIKVPRPTPTATARPSATLPAGAPTFTPGPPQAQVTHVVQPGETCLGIALQYYTTVEEILRLNGLSDCNFLQEGQVLIVPVPGAAPAATP